MRFAAFTLLGLTHIVLGAAPASAQEASLDAPSSVAPGAELTIGWRGPDGPGDFISVSPPGTRPEVFEAYARTSAGSPAVLTAPNVGQYEIRYVQAAGLAVLATHLISVAVVQAQIDAPAQVEPGETLAVRVSEQGDPADYVTIVEEGSPDTAFGVYARLKGALEVELSAPDAPGGYEIRQVQARDQMIVARAPLTVAEPEPQPVSEVESESVVEEAPEPTPEQLQEPSTAASPAPVSDPQDLAESEPEAAPEMAPAVPQPEPAAAPEPATENIAPPAEAAALEPTSEAKPAPPPFENGATLMALSSVDPGFEFNVSWTGPGEVGDVIGVAIPGADAMDLIVSQPAKPGFLVLISAPDRAGQYRLRYVNGDKVLAERELEVR